MFDSMNWKMVKESLKLASASFKCLRSVKQQNKSPSDTTKWDEIHIFF